MSRLSRQLAHMADELDAELARHETVTRKLVDFEFVPGERRIASFDDVSQRTEVVREGDRCCLQCFGVLDCKPYPAAAALYCEKCESERRP